MDIDSEPFQADRFEVEHEVEHESGLADELDDTRFAGSTSGALPFAVSAREQFAALDEPPVTGEARVDAATALLGELAGLPTSDHVAVYEDVHRRLQDALADADVH
jgi:hypothetical protein